MYDRKDTTQQAAARLGLPAEFTAMHEGYHVCIDGRHYRYSCLITDPDCDDIARSRLGRRHESRSDAGLFERTAPKWNCVDYPDGMHYTPGDTCLWCGSTREQIAREPV